ncbi:hypothetical protein JQS43_23400 [Natronosporangium hydrolyticum]|uniref:Tetratricopeptide repeat protein n=1 Tax=Natronosporangium hydrolyticum TaxID=2811111 RepID=A0A895YG72_9ACTN|nr:hypothetical protein [Natronosporangium hydrolyticum]QSB14403.1 hypothetical protein JQS43_23400 [Natronosporangium hydrolyticum]
MWPWRRRADPPPPEPAEELYEAADLQVAQGVEQCSQGQLADAVPLFAAAAHAYRQIGDAQADPRERVHTVTRLASVQQLTCKALNDLGEYDQAVDAGWESVQLLDQLLPDNQPAEIARTAPDLMAEYATSLDDLARAAGNAMVTAAQAEALTEEVVTQALRFGKAALGLREALLDREASATWHALANALLQLGHVELLLEQESAVPRITRANGILLGAEPDDPLRARGLQTLKLADQLFPEAVARNPIAIDPRDAL